MKTDERSLASRQVAIWLLIGVGMMIIQVLLGGITRLTGSGLSITEWKPIMGTLPPLNEHEWNEAFDKYKQIAQFKYVNFSFTLQDFKSIYFWEWFHRLWARLIGVAFIIPFIIFLIRKSFKKEMIRPMVILFLLGALQGLVGWVMVMSGLEDSNRIYVSHYRLAIHFILALGLISYTLWFALLLLIPEREQTYLRPFRRLTAWIMCLLIVQLIYGAFMAGLKAGPYAPTWPDINGSYFAHGGATGGVSQFFDDPLQVQFIHRNLAYIIFLLVIVWYMRSRTIQPLSLTRRTNWILPALAIVQIILGIVTVLNSPDAKGLLWLGVSHQFVAILILLSLIFHFYIVRAGRTDSHPAPF